jgi:hypothetical protein
MSKKPRFFHIATRKGYLATAISASPSPTAWKWIKPTRFDDDDDAHQRTHVIQRPGTLRQQLISTRFGVVSFDNLCRQSDANYVPKTMQLQPLSGLCRDAQRKDILHDWRCCRAQRTDLKYDMGHSRHYS